LTAIPGTVAGLQRTLAIGRAVWRDLKAHHLAHQTFTDVADLDQAIHNAVHDLNQERMAVPLAKPRISAMKVAWELLTLCGLGGTSDTASCGSRSLRRFGEWSAISASARWRSRRVRDFAFRAGVRRLGAATAALRGYPSIGIGHFLFSVSGNMLSEKEEATTQPKDGIWASKQSIRPLGPRSHIFERPDLRPS